eukprot:758322-Hanusia_phi.AAC.7
MKAAPCRVNDELEARGRGGGGAGESGLDRTVAAGVEPVMEVQDQEEQGLESHAQQQQGNLDARALNQDAGQDQQEQERGERREGVQDTTTGEDTDCAQEAGTENDHASVAIPEENYKVGSQVETGSQGEQVQGEDRGAQREGEREVEKEESTDCQEGENEGMFNQFQSQGENARDEGGKAEREAKEEEAEGKEEEVEGKEEEVEAKEEEVEAKEEE